MLSCYLLFHLLYFSASYMNLIMWYWCKGNAATYIYILSPPTIYDNTIRMMTIRTLIIISLMSTAAMVALSSPSSSSPSPSLITIHRSVSTVPIKTFPSSLTATDSTRVNGNDMVMSAPSATQTCSWAPWNKTGYFCGGGIQQDRSDFAAVLNGEIASYEVHWKGLQGEIDCITFSYQAGLRWILQAFTTEYIITTSPFIHHPLYCFRHSCSCSLYYSVTRQSMNLERLSSGYTSRVCPSSSDADRAACVATTTAGATDECVVTELSTTCQPLFTSPSISSWNAQAFMSYRVHFVNEGTVKFRMTGNDTRAHSPFFTLCWLPILIRLI
jgi:hypothetical protein